MKVLWVTNIILPEFAERLGLKKINQGGWLQSLVGAIRIYAPQMELHICSAGPEGLREVVNGVHYYSLGDAYEGRLFLRPSRGFSRCFSRLVHDVQPDIVHFHGSEGLFRTVPHETYADINNVVSMQGILQGCYPHYAGGINELEIRKYRNYVNFLLTRYTITRGAESWRVRLGESERVALSKAKYVMGRTDWDKAWTHYLAPDARYFHVGEVLRPEFYGGIRDAKNIRRHSVFCGGAMAYPLKGGHWLLRAIAALKRDYPDIQLRVANADKVKPKATMKNWLRRNEYPRYLWRIIQENGLEENVVLMPSLTASEVADELRRAEIFCLPSMCENSPNSIGEAMLLGAPIVATDVGGVSSIVENGKEGVLVPSGDPAMLAGAISDMFENPNRASKFAAAAYATATGRYSPEKVVKELEATYKEVMES